MLPTLYSLRSDGKAQEWTIEVEGCRLRTISGIHQKGGKLVTSEWTTCKPKNVGSSNATTPEQQAELEARAEWKKKKDKGYKEDINDINDVGFFEPMLAKEYGDYSVKLDWTQPIYAQPKLDGVRCIVTKGGMFSRNGKPTVSAPHIRQALEPLFDINPHFVFDGELYADKFAENFNKIVSLAKQAKPTAEDLAKSKEHLQYHIYDLYSDENFGLRSEQLKKLITFPGLSDPHIVFVETVQVKSVEHLDELYGLWADAGYEGQMVRLDKGYENKRSKSLLKRKEFIDEEYTIKAVLEGDGGHEKMASKMLFETAAGRPFKAGVNGDRQYCRMLWDKQGDVIGKTATVKYFRLTPDGSPRFGRVTKIEGFVE